MGHSIQYYEFDEKADKDHIFAVANQDAINEGDHGHGLKNDIRFIDELYETKKLARKAIEKHDTGWYDQLAVKFYQYSQVEDTKIIQNIKEQIERYETNLNEYKTKNSVTKRKSKLIGCNKCESKINKEYVSNAIHSLMWNCCPLCENDLSSDTIKKSIEQKKTKLDRAIDSLEKAIDINMRKGEKRIMWLVKTEFHV